VVIFGRIAVPISKLPAILVFACALFLTLSRPLPAQDAGANSIVSARDKSALSDGGWHQLAAIDLVQEKFDELDRMAAEYRSEKSRLPGGDWKLRLFYSALDAPQLTDKDSVDHIAHLERWMQQRPQSITARVALATSLHRWAWVARGNGMANTVTTEGWQLFNERIQRSLQVLVSAAKLDAQCPEWYSEMMTVGLAQSWDAGRMKDIFDRGIQAEPDYFYLYLQYANYLLPKWDGKPGDASAFAKTSADNVGGDAGDELYFQIATVLIKRGDGDFPVHEMDWERIQRGYQALSAQYGATRQSKNQIAFMAYKYKDAAFARQQFDLIGNNWSPFVWRDRKFFDRARDWAQGQGL
jgi:Domain of unknown function (DUF4034)